MTDKLKSLLEEMEHSRDHYIDTKKREEAARSQATAALNKMNTIQKEIDAAIAEIKKNAPRGTDWAEAGRGRVGV